MVSNTSQCLTLQNSYTFQNTKKQIFLKAIFSSFKRKCFICFIESPLKMKCFLFYFYFIFISSSFSSQNIKIFVLTLWPRKKKKKKRNLDQKNKVNFETFNVTTWLTNNNNRHMSNISRSKDNQTMKFSHLIEYHKRNIFSQILMLKMSQAEKTSFCFLKKLHVR